MCCAPAAAVLCVVHDDMGDDACVLLTGVCSIACSMQELQGVVRSTHSDGEIEDICSSAAVSLLLCFIL